MLKLGVAFIVYFRHRFISEVCGIIQILTGEIAENKNSSWLYIKAQGHVSRCPDLI
jgi:hypothetical protein